MSARFLISGSRSRTKSTRGMGPLPGGSAVPLGSRRLERVVDVFADLAVGPRDEEVERADHGDDDHHEQRDPVEVEQARARSTARLARPRSRASARGSAAAMIVTVQPQRPSVNAPSGTQPRERAMIAAITVSRNDR